MKEWFRLNRHLIDTGAKKTYDIWIVVKQKFHRAKARESQELFLDALKKINRK